VLFEEVSGTLFCGDLFTHFGEVSATTTNDLVGVALESEQFGGPTALTPSTAPTIRQLADLDVRTLALMHGPAFVGDCASALRGLADGYAQRFDEATALTGASV
jgi:protoheme ferro-lyase